MVNAVDRIANVILPGIDFIWYCRGVFLIHEYRVVTRAKRPLVQKVG